MKQRLISAFFGIIILVLVLLGNQMVFDVVVSLISIMAIYEVICATGLKEHKYILGIAALMPVLLCVASYFSFKLVTAVIFLFVMFVLVMMLFNHEKFSFSDAAVFISVSIMISLAFLHVSMVRRLGNENYDVLIVLIGSWITDSCAYFSGVFFGKHKLAPKISPKKTIEGSIGGIIGVILILMAYAYVSANIMNVSVNVISVIAIGLVAGILSQFGDLCASIIKREHNIKDFGNIMPGHGGVMDRFDSLIFVAPTVYYILESFPVFVK